MKVIYTVAYSNRHLDPQCSTDIPPRQSKWLIYWVKVLRMSQPVNGEGVFCFWHFINLSLTYLLRHLPSYVQPRDPHGADNQTIVDSLWSVYEDSYSNRGNVQPSSQLTGTVSVSATLPLVIGWRKILQFESNETVCITNKQRANEWMSKQCN